MKTVGSGQWRKEYLPLIPVSFRKSINTFYPGTKLAFTEYTYGGGNHITGGLAQADVLGILGRYDIFAAMHWLTGSSDYISSGYRLYRNYDGAGGSFGDTSVFAGTSDKVNSSVYASVTGPADSSLHIVVINRSTTLFIELFHYSRTNSGLQIMGEEQNQPSLYYPVCMQ
jgi:mannan endo-1,4-beta-mannosidase